MAYVIDRQTKEISIMDTVAALNPMSGPERFLVYHKRQIPAAVYDVEPRYRVIDGNDVRVATPQERVAIDTDIAKLESAAKIDRRNASLESAAVLVETIDETDDPTLLAIRELMAPQFPKWDEHKKTTAARLRAKKSRGTDGRNY